MGVSVVITKSNSTRATIMNTIGNANRYLQTVTFARVDSGASSGGSKYAENEAIREPSD